MRPLHVAIVDWVHDLLGARARCNRHFLAGLGISANRTAPISIPSPGTPARLVVGVFDDDNPGGPIDFIEVKGEPYSRGMVA
jgi:hypothetical protein